MPNPVMAMKKAMAGVFVRNGRPSVLVGWTRRLRSEGWGCRPEGNSTFFRRERKYQRKHAARRLREKALDCPFWRRGSLCRAQWSWTSFTYVWSALGARLFPPSKWAGLFPSAAYRRSCPRSWRGAYSSHAAWDVSVWLRFFCSAKGQRGFKSTLAFLREP